MQLFGSYTASCLPVCHSTAIGLIASTIALVSPDNIPPPSGATTTIPVLEIVKVYGKLAGSECYGKQAPIGTSCQVNVQNIEAKLFGVKKNEDGSNSGDVSLTREEFSDILNKEMTFQWPLKPYGLDKSLSKTATMNKGAETRVYMEELEKRGLYDPRNPTGPLPTSLRPQLNKLLQNDGIDPRASNIVFDALIGSGQKKRNDNGLLNSGQVNDAFRDDLDYYGFLNLIGTDNIQWPN